MVYVIIPCFPFSFYSPYIILLRTVLLIPKVSHGKPELPTGSNINIITTKTYRPVFFNYLRERSLVAWWVCDSVKFWTPLPAVASLALNYSLTQYASSYLPEKRTLTGLISVGDQVPTCPVFTRAKNKVPFWDFSSICRHNTISHLIGLDLFNHPSSSVRSKVACCK